MANVIRVETPSRPGSGEGSRAELRRRLLGLLRDREIDDLKLLVGELAANSIRHSGAEAGTPVVVHLQIDNESIRGTVVDR